ncbi:MAG: 2-C-methyl-D-erythritol 2,4-cyclodiphosphate synthase [Mycoplasmoidaceae bacterium]|nr:2-C-methyl-D-erythritol 2,4-cyclodiphosphate synthase [Mycoplasmoidaceae bacterium]
MEFIGFGKDIHKITKAKSKIVLGGYECQSNYKIIAVSDGDLVLHSVADAILGACQGGDIGIAFPDTDVKCKKMNSKLILNYALTMAKRKNLSIGNIDITIVCDKIMIQPIRKHIVASLKKLLKTKKINVKATRFEQDLNLIECDSIVLMKGK